MTDNTTAEALKALDELVECVHDFAHGDTGFVHALEDKIRNHLTDPGYIRIPAVFAPVFVEIERAMRKFPAWPTDPLHAIGVVNEEVGELNKSLLQAVYEPEKNADGDVRKESVQAAASTLRFFASLDVYEYTEGLQHSQPRISGDGRGAN